MLLLQRLHAIALMRESMVQHRIVHQRNNRPTLVRIQVSDGIQGICFPKVPGFSFSKNLFFHKNELASQLYYKEMGDTDSLKNGPGAIFNLLIPVNFPGTTALEHILTVGL